MPTGDITAKTTEHATMAALKTVLSTYNSGAATSKDDISTFIITKGAQIFYLTRIVRLA